MKKENNFKILIRLITAFFLGLIIVSCSKDDEAMTTEESVTVEETRDAEEDNGSDSEGAITVIPDNIERLFVGKGNESAEKVLIYEQGGPHYELLGTDFEFIVDPINNDDVTDLSSFFRDYYRVYMHQPLTISSEICNREALSEEQSKLENLQTIEMLDRVIRHFKAQGKEVIVAGHSFGGFILTKYIAEMGNTSADTFLIMASRLDMPLTVAEGFLEGRLYEFVNGTDLTFVGDAANLEETTLRKCPSVFSIGGTLLKERFTQKITGTDLSNVVFVYGTIDGSTGRLTDAEIEFLTQRRANVVELTNTDHDGMFFEPGSSRVIEALGSRL